MAADAAGAAWLSAHPPPTVVPALLRAAAACGFGQSCAPGTGATLRALAASKPGGRILNLGTGVGVSCAWLLDGMSDGAALWTVDIDRDLSAIARRHLDGRAHLVVEDGASFLARASAAGERFDLIFADAMPGKYERLDLALGLVAPGGWYVVDDLRPSDDFPEAATLAPALVDRIASDPRFVVVTLDWATGLMLAARR
jgi:predicted O-methyltransferase YrrM